MLKIPKTAIVIVDTTRHGPSNRNEADGRRRGATTDDRRQKQHAGDSRSGRVPQSSTEGDTHSLCRTEFGPHTTTSCGLMDGRWHFDKLLRKSRMPRDGSPPCSLLESCSSSYAATVCRARATRRRQLRYRHHHGIVLQPFICHAGFRTKERFLGPGSPRPLTPIPEPAADYIRPGLAVNPRRTYLH
ncbi:hypothetical protein CKAH01_04127 [Colletotrichum kahawae]|uniref:Uncharacterized protein n=1 Tax=Colletotrichum kahawae TaxID=34407 RepID=A0AAD9YN83_COLKA|nr:hypothetical protein CKAH01_04127 [Colletotrichum kahawae]